MHYHLQSKHPGKSWPLKNDYGTGYCSCYPGRSALLLSAMQQLGYNVVTLSKYLASYIAKFYNIQDIVKQLDAIEPTFPVLTPAQQKCSVTSLFPYAASW